MDKYEVIIFWSDEDKRFIAEKPDLSGCTAHGKTPAEALQNINAAAELWLDTAREFGDPIPEPRQRKIAA